ncbi:dipeptidase [Sporolactobacillus putidus]|uniref:Peptidase M20 n=1 Tax=Sporolactobacillus putidus TaxID=492735 RepID=A0A917S3X5_9BACL|nr:dipeptidase [Sporolactobacillus putidus]GGL56747.1 peptidase M20 [Sporolactobacillus putidus]
MTESWQVYLNENQERFLSEYLEFLRIPSISTDPDYDGDVRKAAEWVVERLQRAGIEKAGTLETVGHPVVYGEWLHAPGQPTLLIYGHFDVQPAVPVSLWDSPPFEPVVKDGKVYGRAASDMKGNLLLPIIGCEALLKTRGSLPINIKFLFEGEEEIGSRSLNAFIKEHQDLLACDTVISADGGCGSEEEPRVTTGVRGIFSMQLNVKTANTDMHSGAGGGIAPNAIHELVRILNSMRDEEGHILVEGFYDQVNELTAEEKEQIAKFSSFTETLKKTTGFKEFFGEPEFTPMERGVARPTLEINGIWGGYQGAGGKTVIPREAHAKITTRLVPDQTPDQVRELLTEHIKKQAVRSIEVTIENGHGANPYRVPQDYPQLLTLEKALEKATGHSVLHQLSGGSVPVMSLFKGLLGAETLTLGAAMDDERAHAPNEFYRLSNFERVQKVYCLFLQEMGR